VFLKSENEKTLPSQLEDDEIALNEVNESIFQLNQGIRFHKLQVDLLELERDKMIKLRSFLYPKERGAETSVQAPKEAGGSIHYSADHTPDEDIPVRSCVREPEEGFKQSDDMLVVLIPANSPPNDNKGHHVIPKREVIYEGIHCSLLTRDEKGTRNKEIHESMFEGKQGAHVPSESLSGKDRKCSSHNYKEPQLPKLGAETSVHACGNKGGGGSKVFRLRLMAFHLLLLKNLR
jgi:hypothetical protein